MEWLMKRLGVKKNELEKFILESLAILTLFGMFVLIELVRSFEGW